ncbi:MAG: RluA family pseudouridine synthase [Myxococcales bacterium]
MKAISVTVSRPELTLARIVREALGDTEVSWNKARELVRSGRVQVDGATVVDAELRVSPGCVVAVDPNAPRLRKGVLSDDAFIHVDADVVVVNKPAGIMSVPFEHGDRDTLIDITRAALRRRSQRGGKGSGFDPELGIVHRIDIDTTGLLVFTRNLSAKRHLAGQFRAHTTHRRYVALVHGAPIGRTFESMLLRDRGDGLRGSHGHFRAARGAPPPDAQRAVTHVRVLERFEQACLVECMLETGRQHQIRIHLSEAGHPLLGERVYIRDFRGERIDAPRPMLHAQELGFVHPRTGRAMRFSQEPPEDFMAVLKRLRGK